MDILLLSLLEDREQIITDRYKYKKQTTKLLIQWIIHSLTVMWIEMHIYLLMQQPLRTVVFALQSVGTQIVSDAAERAGNTERISGISGSLAER